MSKVPTADDGDEMRAERGKAGREGGLKASACTPLAVAPPALSDGSGRDACTHVRAVNTLVALFPLHAFPTPPPPPPLPPLKARRPTGSGDNVASGFTILAAAAAITASRSHRKAEATWRPSCGAGLGGWGRRTLGRAAKVPRAWRTRGMRGSTAAIRGGACQGRPPAHEVWRAATGVVVACGAAAAKNAVPATAVAPPLPAKLGGATWRWCDWCRWLWRRRLWLATLLVPVAAGPPWRSARSDSGVSAAPLPRHGGRVG